VNGLGQDGKMYRRFERVNANSIIVSLMTPGQDEPISGFMRDISLGGLKMQKIADREVPLGIYQCQFVLTGHGKIQAEVEVVGYGTDEDKFAKQIVRMRFLRLGLESKEKIKQFVEKAKTVS